MVGRERSTNETDRCRASAVAIESLMTRLHYTIFVGEPEVIVRTKTQDLAVFRKRNFRAHCTLNGLKVLPLARVLDPLQKGLGS